MVEARVKMVPISEAEALLGTTIGVGGFHMTVRTALETRDSTLQAVYEDEVTGTAYAYAATPFGHVLEVMGRTKLDAIERLGTLAMRP